MRLHPQVRTAVTLAVLLIVLLLALVWGVDRLTRPLPSLSGTTTGDTPVCTSRGVAKGAVVRPGQVTVSVYNAGTTNGQATRVLAELQKRGFSPGEVGNAPDGVRVRGAVVWSGSADNPAVRLVQSQFGSSTRVVPPGDPGLGSGVVVIVGNQARVTPGRGSVVAEAPTTICSPTT